MDFIISNLKNLKSRYLSKLLYIAPILYLLSTKISLAADPDLPKISFSDFFLGDSFLDVLLNLITYLLFIISHYFIGQILSWVGTFFDWTLNLMTTSNTTIVATGWSVSLNFANMFFIILILAIAIATILGMDKFNYKKALPPFLMVAFLINFSMTIGNVVIDFTNVFANYFSSSIASSGTRLSSQAMQAIKITEPKRLAQAVVDKDAAVDGKKQELQKNGEDTSTIDLVTYALLSEGAGKDLQEDNTTSNISFTVFITMITIIVYQLIAIFMLLAGAVYMFSRTLWLWLLLMIAPLAWIAYAFPQGSKIHSQWSNWWGTFLSWCFFAPLFLFFTYLAMLISGSSFNSLIKDTALINNHGITAGVVIQLIAVGFMMVAGLFISKKLGVGGSNFVVNYATGVGGAASKKFKELRTAGPLSAENLGKRFGGIGARGVAGIPMVGRIAGYRKDEVMGRLELDKQKERKEDIEKEKLRHIGRMAGMTDDQKRLYLMNATASARAGTGTTSLEQSAAINMLMEDKIALENMSEVEQGYLRQAVAAATSATQRNNIAVSYSASLKARSKDTEEARKAVKEAREKQEKAFEAYAKHLTEEDKKAQREAKEEAKEWELYAERLTEKDIEKTGGSRG